MVATRVVGTIQTLGIITREAGEVATRGVVVMGVGMAAGDGATKILAITTNRVIVVVPPETNSTAITEQHLTT